MVRLVCDLKRLHSKELEAHKLTPEGATFSNPHLGTVWRPDTSGESRFHTTHTQDIATRFSELSQLMSSSSKSTVMRPQPSSGNPLATNFTTGSRRL